MTHLRNRTIHTILQAKSLEPAIGLEAFYLFLFTNQKFFSPRPPYPNAPK